MNELQEEINKLKHQEIVIEQLTKTETAHQFTNLTQAIPKNVNTISLTNRGLQKYIDLLTIINFLEKSTTVLSKYGEQLKTQLTSI